MSSYLPRALSAEALEYERAYQESRMHGSSSWSTHPSGSFFQGTRVPHRKPGDPFGPIEAMASLVRSPNPEGQPLAPARSAQEFFTPSQVEMISGVRTSTRYEWEDAMRGGATFSDSRGGATYSGYERDGGRYPVLPEGAIGQDPGYIRYRSPVTYASTTHVHRQAVSRVCPLQKLQARPNPRTHMHKKPRTDHTHTHTHMYIHIYTHLPRDAAAKLFLNPIVKQMSRPRNNGSMMPKVDLGIDRFLRESTSSVALSML